ncbi:MAG: hypothetical protein V8S99_10910 [Oscillospiraceae bacterium]
MVGQKSGREILHSVYHACSPIFGRIHDADLYGSYARRFQSGVGHWYPLTVDLEQAEIAKHRNDMLQR